VPSVVNLTEGKPCVLNGMSQMSVLVMIGSLFCRLTPSVEKHNLFISVRRFLTVSYKDKA
jgi:hypothetical protein